MIYKAIAGGVIMAIVLAIFMTIFDLWQSRRK